MQETVNNWISQSQKLRTGLNHWVAMVNQKNPQKIANLYHSNARLFPTFGSLRNRLPDIQNYFAGTNIRAVTLNQQSISYRPEEQLIEGEYTFRMLDGQNIKACFAFKFNHEGLILEHASAPQNIQSWRVRNEVNICTLLTASTVKSILARRQTKPLAV